MADEAKTKKVDPGWNDPPTLNYSSSNPPPKSRISNKRIAFPLSPQVNSPQSTSPKPTGGPGLGDKVLGQGDNVPKLQDVMKNLDILLVNQDDQMLEKLEVMKVMWQDNKFSSKIQTTIESMIKEVMNKNAAKANEYCLQLMMEDSTLCEPWIVVFRQLMKDMNKVR